MNLGMSLELEAVSILSMMTLSDLMKEIIKDEL